MLTSHAVFWPKNILTPSKNIIFYHCLVIRENKLEHYTEGSFFSFQRTKRSFLQIERRQEISWQVYIFVVLFMFGKTVGIKRVWLCVGVEKYSYLTGYYFLLFSVNNIMTYIIIFSHVIVLLVEDSKIELFLLQNSVMG